MNEPYFAVRRSQTVSEVIDGEAIVINMETGCYYSLSRSGVAVWERLLGGARPSDLATAIRARYEPVPEDLGAVVTALLVQLEAEGLVVRASEPTAGRLSGDAPADARPPSSPKLPYEQPTLERYTDMQEFLLVDPIHEVTEEGWPHQKSPRPEGP